MQGATCDGITRCSKHAVTRRNDCCWCEQVQVGYFKVLRGVGGDVHPGGFSCVCGCRLWRSGVSSGGVQTSVTLTLMNHTAPGSACAGGCEARLSKLVLLFTRDDPEGPGIACKQKHTTADVACIFYGTEQLGLNTLALWIWWMCASSFVWSDGLMSSLTGPFSAVFDDGQ